MPAPAPLREMPEKYGEFLTKLKERISRERVKAILSANSALVLMYWDIGQSILERQRDEGWGAKVIDRLSHDLKKAFPDMSGFSPRNLKYMRKFAESWSDRAIVQEVLAQITWYHNLTLLEKCKDNEVRLWYAGKTIENGWSRNILAIQIETRLHERQGKAVSNFPEALPPADSDMAAQIFKDPYVFDFLGTDDPRRETELEQKLVDHIQSFLLELGQGFAFVGRQVHLEVGDDDFYIDLLFYHLRLRCYVIVELKVTKFKPGHVSQLNMYLNAVDDLLRHPDDKPSIGLLLVKEKNKMVVEYSLAGYTKPIGVADWERQITRSLPEELKSSLPTIEEIEAELGGTGVDDGE
ncbi:MAG: PDDEXK nuclease domain-containing protein [Chloroflexota bacterium]|nr:PDDEXK nuclease domain-containing protein [Chloroflexota bacterium]